jgi:hypothetical protein
MTPITLTTQQKRDYLYMPNQRVSFLYGEKTYAGRVCGMGTNYNAIPFLGTMWIVRLESPIEGYCYECVGVPSLHMEPLEGM